MNLIVNVDKNWAIGFRGGLLNRIPEDMAFFRKMTTGKVILMGRKTLESFPNGRPLKQRTNVVITGQQDYQVDGAIVVHSVEEALTFLKPYKDEDIFVIGGGSIYRQFLPYCDVAHVTQMDYAYEADTWFPNLDEMEDFIFVDDSEERTYFNVEYRFKLYMGRERYQKMLEASRT